MNYEFESTQYEGELAPILAKALQGYPKVMRLTNVNGSGRYYFTYNNGIKVYNSGTTALKHIDLGGSRYLEEWRRKLINAGKDPEVVLAQRADYGTILHVIYANVLMGEKIPLSPVPLKKYLIEVYKEVISQEGSESFINKHLEEYTKDLLSFMKWRRDYKVKALAIELMLKSDTLRLATAIDLICEITFTEKVKDFWGEVYKADSKSTGAKKGDPKATLKEVQTTKIVVVDFKSGKKGFYDKHIMQLNTNKLIIEENIPDLKIDGCYNFAPIDWKSKPSYRFTNQDAETNDTDSIQRSTIKKLLPSVLEGGKILFEENVLSKRFRVYGGDTDSNLDETYRYISIEQYAQMKLEEKYPNISDFERVLQTEGIEDTKTLKLYLQNSPDVHIEWLAEALQEDLNHTDAQKAKFGTTTNYIIKNTKF